MKRVREYLLDQDHCEWCYVPISFFLFACLAVFFVCTYQVGWVFTTERDVTLSRPYWACLEPPSTRCYLQYDAILPDGERARFEPHTFEFQSDTLRYDLKIRKSKYSFTYRFDGVEQPWPYLPKLALAWILSLAGFALWLLLAGPIHLGRFMRRGEA